MFSDDFYRIYDDSIHRIGILDRVHFRCVTQDLRHQWIHLDETLGAYRVDPDIMQRHIFDFRFRPQTGSGLFFGNRKLKTS